MQAVKYLLLEEDDQVLSSYKLADTKATGKW